MKNKMVEKLIKQTGMKKVTEKVVEGLKKRNTKTAEEVIERIEYSDYFEVYENEETITINTEFYVTKQEVKQYEMITGKKFIELRSYLEANNLEEEFLNIWWTRN